jgi:hypothetical protein
MVQSVEPTSLESRKRKIQEFEVDASSFEQVDGADGWPAVVKQFDIHMHRPSPSDCSVHCSLMHPVLAQFVDDLKTGPMTAQDYSFTLKLCSAMCTTYAAASQRLSASTLLLEEYFGCGILNTVLGNDCAVRVQCGKNQSQIAVPFVMAANNEVGVGTGSAPEQCVGLYCKILTWSETRYVQDRCICPAVLLSLCGPYFSVSVATHGAGVAVDPVTAMLPLLVLPHDRPMMEATARALAATKRCVNNLIAYYPTLTTTVPIVQRVDMRELRGPPPQVYFPYPRSIRDGDITFSYTEQLSLSKLVFRVKVTTVAYAGLAVQVGDAVIVKFTRTYCAEAHEICYAAGRAAPQLNACESLPGGWKLVALEYIAGAVQLQQPVTDNAVSTKLGEAVTALHVAGYVHGDLRACNVLQSNEGSESRVCVIDFDWAGKEGEQIYPSFMNDCGAVWPEGAASGMPLRRAHDGCFLQQLLCDK